MVSLFERLQETFQPEGGKPSWWRERQEEGRRSFLALGIPTPRWERYRYTPLRLKMLQALKERGVSEEVHPIGGSQWEGYHLWLVNGAMGQRTSLPPSVRIAPLEGYGSEKPKGFGEIATEEDPFVALNGASFRNGVVVEVAGDVDRPLYLHHVTTEREMQQGRFLIRLKEGSRAHIVDIFGGGDLRNDVVECIVERGAELRHTLLQQSVESRTCHLRHAFFTLGKGCRLAQQVLTWGKGFVRNSRRLSLEGKGAVANLSGAYLVGGQGHIEHGNFITHKAAATAGHTYYKGVAVERSKGVFDGEVRVMQRGVKTDASQLHHGWMFGGGRMVARPNLTIAQGKVACRHGVTFSQPSEEALFYLASRGVGLTKAYLLLLGSFWHEVVDGIGIEEVTTTVSERLQGFYEGIFTNRKGD